MKQKRFKALCITWEIFPMMEGGLGPLMRSAVDELRRQDVEVTVLVPHIPNHLEIPDVIDLQKEVKKYLKKDCSIEHLDFSLNTFLPPKKSKQKNWPRLYSRYKDNQGKRKTIYPNNTPLITRAFAFAVRDYIKKHNEFDIVIGPDWEMIPSFQLLKNTFPDLPFVFYINATEYDRSFEKMGNNARIIHEMEQKYYKQADGIIAISHISANLLHKVHEVPKNKLTVVFDDIEFEPKILGFNELQKGKNVLFIGRVGGQKGLPFLIDTAKKVVEISPDVRFILAGDGDMLPWVVEQVAEYELEKNVLFTGWVNDEEKKQLYRSSDLFVMPSPSEPFGLTPLEAVRSGVPVISSDTCGFLGVIPSTPTFKYFDTNQFVQMILYYLGNKEAATTLLRSQQEDLSKHSWSHEIAKLIQTCEQLITPSTHV